MTQKRFERLEKERDERQANRVTYLIEKLSMPTGPIDVLANEIAIHERNGLIQESAILISAACICPALDRLYDVLQPELNI